METTTKVVVNVTPVADAPTLPDAPDLNTPEDTTVALNLTQPRITDALDQNGSDKGDHGERLGAITLSVTKASAIGIPSNLAQK